MRVGRPFDAALDRRQRREVKDRIDAVRCSFNSRGIGHIGVDNVRRRMKIREVVALAGAEIVEDSHPVAAGRQRFHEMRTDEARARR